MILFIDGHIYAVDRSCPRCAGRMVSHEDGRMCLACGYIAYGREPEPKAQARPRMAGRWRKWCPVCSVEFSTDHPEQQTCGNRCKGILRGQQSGG